MTYRLGFLVLILAVKGFGGSFHSLFPSHGGPILGTLLSGLIVAFLIWHPRFASRVPQGPFVSNKTTVLALALVLIGAGIFLRVQKILHTPLNVFAADMLPFIQAGLEDVLAGKSPYHSHTLGHGGTYPHFYLPSLWLGYLPFQALGWDLRWWNLLAQALFWMALLDLFLRREHYPYGSLWSSIGFLTVLALSVFSKQSLSEVAHVQTASFWIATTLWVWGTFRGKAMVAAVALGFLLLCRETAFLLVAPLAIWTYRHDRSRFGRTALICAAIGVGLTLPFLISTPSGFFAGVRHYAQSSMQSPASEMNRYFGLAGVFKEAGLMIWLPFLQWALPLVSLGWAVRTSARSPFAAISWGGVSYTGFILFTAASFPYLFVEPLIMVCLLLIGLPEPETRS